MIDLSKETIDEYIKENKFIVIKFYREECDACKMLKPFYDDLAEKLKDKFVFSQYELTEENSEFSKKFRIEAVPTFVLYIEGEKAMINMGYPFQKEQLDFFVNKYEL